MVYPGPRRPCALGEDGKSLSVSVTGNPCREAGAAAGHTWQLEYLSGDTT